MRAILMILLSAFWYVAAWGENNKVKVQEERQRRWGKLFFSAKVRMQHEQYASLQDSVVYQGILQSVGKKPTYWLNETMQQLLPLGMSCKNTQIIIQQGEKRITLAPGESYDVTEQGVIETVLEETQK